MTLSQFHNQKGFLTGIRVIAVLLFAVVLYASCVPTTSPPSITHMDKIMHLAVYFILAIAIWAGWPTLRKTLLFLICISYGALIEVVQSAMQLGRTGSVWDGLANGFGAALGLMLISATAYMWKRHKP